jgi:diguanylate cyclase (GGDEF)-like protein
LAYRDDGEGFQSVGSLTNEYWRNAMNLDVNTLFLVTVYVETILGLLLLFAWAQNTAITAVAWWGLSHLLRAASVTLFGLYGAVPDLISIDLANAILFTSFAVTWTGARLFDHRKPQYVLLFAGAAVWLIACRIPGFAASLDMRVLLSSGTITAYTWATAFEFWRGRSEPLVSRWPAIIMLFAHGALYVLRTPLGDLLPWLTRNNPLLGSVWLSALSFEALLFTISIAFILLAMAKERAEQRHKTAALVDSLTGISNRRAFLEEGEEHLKRQTNDPRPTAVMLLDLDHFKSINDRHGHPIGDRVLEIFAKVTSSCLRRSDLFGRLGGEEFAALLYDTDRERALAVAEQIRTSFAAVTGEVEGRPVGGTVSIGIVIAYDAMLGLSALLAQADHALYRAKDAGRNCVEIGSIELVLDRANGRPTPEMRRATPMRAGTKSAAA